MDDIDLLFNTKHTLNLFFNNFNICLKDAYNFVIKNTTK